jgi:hypothetical protein
MGHTKSLRAQRYAVLATPIGRYATCYLVLSCQRCRERKELRIELLIQDGRGEQTVEKFLMRLRCRTCGDLPHSVRMQAKSGQASPSKEIVLVGPG